MRKFFYGLGVVMAVLIVAGGIGFFFLARSGMALDSASKAYVDDSTVRIVANWDVKELWKRTGSRFKAASKYDDMAALFDAAKGTLGPMLEYRGSQGQALMSVNNAHTAVSARYVAIGHFQKGDAQIQIALVKQGDVWMIEGFHINSSALFKRLVGTQS